MTSFIIISWPCQENENRVPVSREEQLSAESSKGRGRGKAKGGVGAGERAKVTHEKKMMMTTLAKQPQNESPKNPGRTVARNQPPRQQQRAKATRKRRQFQ